VAVVILGSVEGGPSWWARFLGARWRPPAIPVVFPDRCPCCMRPATRAIAIWGVASTSADEETHLRLMAPVCRRVMAPLLSLFLEILCAFVAVLVFLATIVGHQHQVAGAIVVWIFAAGALVLHWRRGWLELAGYGPAHLRFRARRRDYAELLAKLNGGRVV
jgi:hypothetical protein